MYDDAYLAALDLRAAINAFVAAPGAVTFKTAKDTWKTAREAYGQTEALRFSDGPIDNPLGPEPFINSWPLDEAYIDYVSGNPTSGIINDTSTYPVIDATVLLNANLYGSEENVAIGYHAMEFLLRGQDTSTSNAGERSYLDYVDISGASFPDRRRAYLQVCAELLVTALLEVRDAWAPGIGSYYTEFIRMPVGTALRKIFVGACCSK